MTEPTCTIALCDRAPFSDLSEFCQRHGLLELRKPFPDESVGTLPATEKRPVELSYVGHAAVTDRLLTVDPEWYWEPFAIDADGLPQYDRNGGLWIRLTICRVTRLGYGDSAGQVTGPKVIIGDAIRNSGLRFGIATYLWSKEDLESLIGNEQVKSTRMKAPRGTSRGGQGSRPIQGRDPRTEGKTEASPEDKNTILDLCRKLDPPITSMGAVALYLSDLIGEQIVSPAKLSDDQAKAALAKMKGDQ